MIEDVIKFPAEPAGLYDPLRYMMGIGGKRIRPTLCLKVYGLYGKEPGPDILEAAAAIELFHTFSLIHDDIMDRSPLRRGVPTVWKKWDETTAILSGDEMLIEAYKHIAKVPAACLDRALGLFTRTASEVCEGQQYDMDFENLPFIPMSDYLSMIGLKTAVLLACSTKMGALIGGASIGVCDALYQFGYKLGIAFQITDDYLDTFGNEKVFGKKIGGDIMNNKKTWLLVESMRRANGEQKLQLEKLMQLGEEDRAFKIESVRMFYEQLGVKEAAEAEILVWHKKALESLSQAGFSHWQTHTLEQFAESIIHREK